MPNLPPPSAFLSSSPGEVALSATTLTAAATESLPVPQLASNLHGSTDPYANWTVRVHGHVTHPQKFTIEQLAETFQVVTLPVTLVCAGNRRKEQNVVRKSLGFDWGAAGGAFTCLVSERRLLSCNLRSFHGPVDWRLLVGHLGIRPASSTHRKVCHFRRRGPVAQGTIRD